MLLQQTRSLWFDNNLRLTGICIFRHVPTCFTTSPTIWNATTSCVELALSQGAFRQQLNMLKAHLFLALCQQGTVIIFHFQAAVKCEQWRFLKLCHVYLTHAAMQLLPFGLLLTASCAEQAWEQTAQEWHAISWNNSATKTFKSVEIPSDDDHASIHQSLQQVSILLASCGGIKNHTYRHMPSDGCEDLAYPTGPGEGLHCIDDDLQRSGEAWIVHSPLGTARRRALLTYCPSLMFLSASRRLRKSVHWPMINETDKVWFMCLLGWS